MGRIGRVGYVWSLLCAELVMCRVCYVSSCPTILFDDTSITSTWKRHMQVLEEFLGQLRAAHFNCKKPSKFFSGFLNLECLGHIIGGTIIRPFPDKVLAIQKAESPTTKKQVHSFLGLIGF